MFFHRL